MSYVSPPTADKDWVRLLIGDTDTTDEALSDDEITAILGEEGASGTSLKYFAAAMALDILAASWASKGRGFAEKQVGKLRKRWGVGGGRITLKDYAASLRARGARRSARQPYVMRAVRE